MKEPCAGGNGISEARRRSSFWPGEGSVPAGLMGGTIKNSVPPPPKTGQQRAAEKRDPGCALAAAGPREGMRVDRCGWANWGQSREAGSECIFMYFFLTRSLQSLREALLFPFANEEVEAYVSYLRHRAAKLKSLSSYRRRATVLMA